ncbi:MAG: hypothetical protein E2O54_14275 [Gammaproteobacteria bacterium]|nr:MAG: hypothetical protein E2O54_14275 [Gammaproteobacteria bacterium]
MSHPRNTSWSRFLLLFLAIFSLSIIQSEGVSAAPWDNLKKKAQELIKKTADALDLETKAEEEADEAAVANNTKKPPADTSSEQAVNANQSQVPESQADGVRSIGGVAPTQSAAITATSADMALQAAPYFLLRLKFQPGDVTEDEFLTMTESQVMADKQAYKQADDIEKTRGYYTKIGNGTIPSGFQTKLAYREKALADAMRGAVFARDEVEGREPRYAARELVSKYRDRLEKLAAALPDSYTLEFSNTAVQYKYDHDLGGLYFDRNWFKCDVDAIEGCLSNGRGSHFFIRGGNRSREDGYKTRRSEFEGDFILNPPRHVPGLDNPFGLPNSLLRVDTANEGLFNLPGHTLVSVDRRLEMLTLKMDARTAEEISKVRQGSGADNKRQIRTVLHFTVNELLGNAKYPTFKVSLDRLEIFSPENKLLLSDTGSGFRLGTEVLAGEHAKQQAAEKKLAAEHARYDIVGVKLGMSLAAAEKIVREHMSPTSEYRYERKMDIPGTEPRPQTSGAYQRSPFGRSVVFIRLESTPPAKFLARDTSDSNQRWQVDLTGNDERKRRQYWNAVASQEVITLSVEKGADGEDEVFGIYRTVKLSNPNLSAIGDSLKVKYGKPVREQGNYAVWGNQKCPPSDRLLGGDSMMRMEDGTVVHWGERRAGVALMTVDAKNAMRVVRYVSLTDSRWARLSAEAAYGHCGPVVSANWNAQGLTMTMADFKSYFARFEELFASDEEAVAVKL